ncbi:TPA: LysR family transcriptional regulator [Pseudomonas aeruginosa]|nr:LysR family transcriptional regulator [Pseudomonas aeruginosa]HEK0151623.1 LysR family transcriptional regulator [Pseudomonas aeruginosa]HEK0165573.1 LysR family transcriptional regulator [Pseudomonas aeruginosa]
MDLRHLRCFSVLAEELHFTRAAERLHIEQSPLSRTIKELESSLGAVLFDRDRRGTRLTPAGVVFQRDVDKVFRALDLAQENVRAISAGCRGTLRIAVSDGAVGPKLSEFLASCREEIPGVHIRIYEVSLREQRAGLHAGNFDLGLSYTADLGSGISALPLWSERIVLAIPARHPLLEYEEVPPNQLIRYPLVMCDPQAREGLRLEFLRFLEKECHEAQVAETTSSVDAMLMLVAAGYGVGFSSAAKIPAWRMENVVFRPMATEGAMLTTYLLRRSGGECRPCLDEFVSRLRAFRTV